MFLMDKGWPDVTDETLLLNIDDWLASHIYGMKSHEDLKRLHMFDIVQAMLSWEQRRELDSYAPTHLLVPSGSSIPIDYSDPGAPHVSVRLQEMFGLQDTPFIARGKAALTLHLLSPAQRPVQVTRDLASFWREAYFDVKRDLKGRYPKHYWPDDPLNAIPTNRTRAKM
jgi:ATP-dependent helicase HrpB